MNTGDTQLRKANLGGERKTAQSDVDDRGLSHGHLHWGRCRRRHTGDLGDVEREELHGEVTGVWDGERGQSISLGRIYLIIFRC